jgi:anaerobic magnesium-protoporphyrin IX monomethyl ester cyclase
MPMAELTVPLVFYPLAVRYNAGLALLASILRARGIESDLCLLSSESEFLRRLVAWNSPVVCFSAVTETDYRRSLPYMRLAHDHGKLVLLGGTWTGLGRPVPDYVDLVCRGDGETLADYFLEADDRLFRELMVTRDLNALPVPDYEMWRDIPFDRGLPETDGKKCLPYLSSRGCPYPCTFCQIRQQPAGMRIRTKVAEDLTDLTARYRPDLWFFGDALLPYHSATWRKSWGRFRHPFVAYIRADASPEALGWLVDRGLTGCAFGIESGDEDYRNRVLRKGLTDAAIWRTVEILRANGVWFIPYFMHGTPGETMAIRTKTAAMARAIGPYAMTWQYEELTSWRP